MIESRLKKIVLNIPDDLIKARLQLGALENNVKRYGDEQELKTIMVFKRGLERINDRNKKFFGEL